LSGKKIKVDFNYDSSFFSILNENESLDHVPFYFLSYEMKD